VISAPKPGPGPGPDTLARQIDYFKLQEVAAKYGLDFDKFYAAYRECFEFNVQP